nr:hypothetical protein [Sicyoidochytrium minutum DNA virus]
MSYRPDSNRKHKRSYRISHSQLTP